MNFKWIVVHLILKSHLKSKPNCYICFAKMQCSEFYNFAWVKFYYYSNNKNAHNTVNTYTFTKMPKFLKTIQLSICNILYLTKRNNNILMEI